MCPDGFEGPRCEQYKISLDGSGWAWFDPIQSCSLEYISVEFMTTSDTGLLLYNGPMEAMSSGTKNQIATVISAQLATSYGNSVHFML